MHIHLCSVRNFYIDDRNLCSDDMIKMFKKKGKYSSSNKRKSKN